MNVPGTLSTNFLLQHATFNAIADGGLHGNGTSSEVTLTGGTAANSLSGFYLTGILGPNVNNWYARATIALPDYATMAVTDAVFLGIGSGAAIAACGMALVSRGGVWRIESMGVTTPIVVTASIDVNEHTWEVWRVGATLYMSLDGATPVSGPTTGISAATTWYSMVSMFKSAATDAKTFTMRDWSFAVDAA